MSSTLARNANDSVLDPYHRWLGIRDAERPPNHYRLLGLELLEEDIEVIRDAADRQLSFVRKQRFGQHADLAKKLMSEIDAARSVLLDSRHKAMYDSLLRPQLASASSEATGGAGRASNPVECGGCGTSNSPERKFCSECGALLWAPCIGCGAVNAASERFCGACGVNLEEAVQKRIGELETQETYALSLQVAGRHREAIDLIQQLATTDHPRDPGHGRRMRELADEMRGEVAGLERRRDEACPLARQLAATFDFDGAAKVLADVPDWLQTDEIRKVHVAVQARRQEIAALTAEIRDRMVAKEFAGLLPTVERLLAIKPDHEASQNLVGKLREFERSQAEMERDRLCETAKRCLQEHNYDGALDLLEKVTAELRNAEVDKLLEYSHEVAWLAGDLRDETGFDGQTPPIVQRLLKLRPQDPLAGRVMEQLRQAAKPGDKHVHALSNGHARRQSKTLGLPLLPLKAWQRIVADTVLQAPAFRERVGAYCVAAGLALAGLGRSELKINLRPPEKESLLKKFSLGRKGPTSAWGIDPGEAALKAVKLTWDAAGGRVVAEAFDFIAYATPLSDPEADADALLRAALDEFLSRHKLDEAAVAVGFPSQELLARFLKVPFAAGKLDDLVAYEARQQVPFPLEEVIWGFQAMGDATRGEELGSQPLALFAVKKSLAEKRVALFREQGIKVDHYQGDALALANFLAFDRLTPGDDAAPPGGAVAVLDMGVRKTNCIFLSRNAVWLRTVPFGGADFNKTIVRELKVVAEKAEQYKRRPATAPQMNKLYRGLQPAFEELGHELRRTLEHFAAANPGCAVEELLCIGEGFRLHGLLRHL